MVVREVVIAHRHAPAYRQLELQRLVDRLAVQVAFEQEVAQTDVAACRFAQELFEPIRRQPLTRAGNAQHIGANQGAAGDIACGDDTLAKVLAVEQLPLAGIPSRPLPG
ncbi:hypothetical protein D3C72_2125250 [compost metagenome]